MKPKRFTKKNCGPMVKNKTINKKSCYTDSIMLKLKKEYNKQNPKDKITFTKPNSIWNAFKRRMKGCENEICWLKKLNNSNISQKVSEIAFSPKHPASWKKNPNEWLTNIDIENVLKQYEEAHTNFEFIGTSFIDFNDKIRNKCVDEEVCALNLQEQINNNKNKIGLIFNLDKHYQDGSHWVSMFIDLNHKYIFYFDSTGEKIPKEFKHLVNELTKQGKELVPPIEFKFHENHPFEHQYEDTECGLYSLFFIITCLEEKINNKKVKPTSIFNLFKKKRISDKQAQTLRNKYFN